MGESWAAIPQDSPTTVYDPLGERCVLLAVDGAHCRVRYGNGTEDEFLIEDLEHPDGQKGVTKSVTYVSMREVFERLSSEPVQHGMPQDVRATHKTSAKMN